MSNMISGMGAVTPWVDSLPAAGPGAAGQGAGAAGGGGFGGVLKSALQEVNQLNTGAESQIGGLLQGGPPDMTGVMVAVEKADVAFQLMMQVRNKIVTAYQDIEKMQF